MMRTDTFSVGLALLSCVLSSCALGPNYARPDLRLPTEFRWQTNPAEAPSYGDLGWWQVYDDPALQALFQTALQNNLDVRIAAARIDQARATLRVSRLSQLPQVSGNASGSRAESSTEFLTPGAPRERDTYTVQGSASWELDLWGRLRRASEAARADLLAADYARDGVMVSLVGDVANNYFGLLSLDEQLDITKRTVATREKFVELTQARHDRGVVSGLDVATAVAQLSAAKANVPDLERQIAQAENALSILIGSYPTQIVRGTLNAQPAAPVPPPGLPSSLLERRPDIRQAEAGLIAANARVGVAKAALFPTLSLTGSAGSQSTSLSDLFTGPTQLWSLGGNLLLPLLDPQRNLFQLDLANARKREAILQYQKAVQNAFRDVADALIARSKSAEFEQAQLEQVQALRHADEIALARYGNGSASYFDVINAERDLFTAELTLSSARRNTRQAAVQLYRVLGGGWQLPTS